MARAVATNVVALKTTDGLVVIYGQADAQDAFGLTAAHGQQTMAGTALQRLFPFEIVAVFLGFVRVFLALDYFRLDEGFTTEGSTNLIARPLVLAHLFGYDVLGSMYGSGDVRNVAHNKALGGLLGVGLALHHEDGGQRLQSLFACYLCTGAPLGFIGQIDVFQRRQVPTGLDALLQLAGHLVLFRNGFDDGLLAFGYFLQPFHAVADGCYLHLVQSARPFLAVAGDERNGAALVEQFQGVLYSVLLQMQLAGNQLGEYLQVFHRVMGVRC